MTGKRLRPTVENAVASFAGRLGESLGSALVSLRVFGSQARGHASPESDVDVFVLVKERTPQVETAISDAAFETNLQFDVFLAPTVYGEEEFQNPVLRETPFLRAVEREGISV